MGDRRAKAKRARFALTFALALALGVGGAAAQTGIDLGFDPEAMPAVGRLNRPNAAPCTAVLVASNKALTTASCVHQPSTAAPIEPGRMNFLAGYRAGRFRALRRAIRVDVHPGYAAVEPGSPASYGVDFALLTLSRPIRSTRVFAFGAPNARVGRLAVASYDAARPEFMTVRAPCAAKRSASGLIATACEGGAAGPGAALLIDSGDSVRLAGLVVARLNASADGSKGVVVAARPPESWLVGLLRAEAAPEEIETATTPASDGE